MSLMFVFFLATERIRQRLQRYISPKPPPPLHHISPPVPEIPPTLLWDKMAAVRLLDADLSILTEFTKYIVISHIRHKLDCKLISCQALISTLKVNIWNQNK